MELKKQIFDEQNGLSYTLVGDYYIPDLRLSPETEPIGKWGRLHREYLKEHKIFLFEDLLLTGELHRYLLDLETQAKKRLEVLISQMKAREGITEDMKAADQMAWVGAMNSIRNRAEEIILRELIYV